MNWIAFLSESQRKEGAKALRKAADYLEASDQRALGELVYVLGYAVEIMKRLGVDPAGLLHKGVDWAITKASEAVQKAHDAT